MKRREVLTLLAPALLLGACKESEKFTLPTIVTGKVTYEDGSPVEGAELRFSGLKRHSLTNISLVFEETVYTDASGKYSASHVIPKERDFVEIKMSEGSFDEPTPAYGYDVYLLVDGVYRRGLTYMIPYGNYGKTTTVDYELRKK